MSRMVLCIEFVGRRLAAMASALPQLRVPLYQPPDAATQAALGIQAHTHLGDGGFKSVYACTFNGTDAVVSVDALGRGQAKEAAVQARLASQPTHPHVNTALRGPMIVAGRSYTVLPRLPVTLFNEVIGDHPDTYPEATARTHFAQILSGLRHLHRLAVAHRDIKLENILLSQEREACLIDFNLSVVVPPGGSSLTTSDAGTESYRAPEVVGAGPGRPYDMFKADVWSLGVVLFTMSAGVFLVGEAKPADLRFRCIVEAQRLKQCIVAALFKYYERAGHVRANPQTYARLAVLKDNADLAYLLNQLLRIDPAERMSLDEISQLPWLAAELERLGEAALPSQLGWAYRSLRATSPAADSMPAPAYKSLGAASPAADSVPTSKFRGLGASSPVHERASVANFDEVLAALIEAGPCVGAPPITRQNAMLGSA